MKHSIKIATPFVLAITLFIAIHTLILRDNLVYARSKNLIQNENFEPILTWERSSNSIPGGPIGGGLEAALQLETGTENVWDSSIGDRNYAYWNHTYSIDLHKFKTTFTLDSGQYEGVLSSPGFPFDLVPINDNLYVFVNGIEVFRGGTSYSGVSRDTGLVPETDGWYINGITINNLRSGENIIEVITEERSSWGGMGELQLALESTEVLTDSDLAVTKTGPSEVAAGGLIIYDITVANQGDKSAANVVITDTLPVSTTFVSSSLEGVVLDENAGTVVWTIDFLPGGGVEAFTIQVQVNENIPVSTLITNTIKVASSAPDPIFDNNQDSQTAVVTFTD
ncbi:MAG: DUF11 domain-containing protein, partial [Chloroflexi bacterium]|nr:DUF11 domain-containing protein [Chloroflexota bacterium]